MPETTFMGVPRSAIDWSPRIDYSKCNYCMECAKFCPHQVYEQRDGKLVVANPQNCVVFCRACGKTCGLDAIAFPDKAEVTAKIKELRKGGA